MGPLKRPQPVKIKMESSSAMSCTEENKTPSTEKIPQKQKNFLDTSSDSDIDSAISLAKKMRHEFRPLDLSGNKSDIDSDHSSRIGLVGLF